ncbi:alcohol dehydrogenase catalytic domain-containing protein [Streptomyces sp. NBC_00631]|uniref:alcohol dehydrogenase catalytic domain-containing protein n=1 Tax=Streptomyces sp. NBC_00631 TaxID=2975793 RepID=UPI0038644324
MCNGALVPGYPLVRGHEALGVITGIAEQVTGAGPRDRPFSPVLDWAVPCRECRLCRHAEPWPCTAVQGVGARAEEAVLPLRSVVLPPGGVPLDLARALFFIVGRRPCAGWARCAAL